MREQRLGLEVARAVAVEPALAQPKPSAEDLLEHLAFHRADGPVDLGELVIGARMLLQNGHPPAVAPGHLGLDPPVVEDRAELDQPAFPVVAGHLGAVKVGQAIGDPSEEDPAELAVLDGPHHLVPEDDGEVGVILAEPLVRLDARLVSVFGPASAAMLDPPLDHPRADQPGQPVTDRRRRHVQVARPSRRPSAGRAAGSDRAAIGPSSRPWRPCSYISLH